MDNQTIRELKPFAAAFLDRAHVGTMFGRYTVLIFGYTANEEEKDADGILDEAAGG